jgi:hypothetical protein
MLAGHIDIENTTISHREASGSSSSTNTVYDLLVIAPDGWKDDIAPLKQHKESHGMDTIVVGLDEIYDGDIFSVSGRDEAEQVKYFIKNALDEWNITYVLLIGGRQPGVDEQWYCPVRYISEELWEGPYLGDLYFADIYNEDGVFQSWDTNEDDLFGTQNDDMDLYPDVYLGRWACRSIRDLRTVIDKTIAYETQATHSNKIVLVGGDIFDDEEQHLEGEMIPEQSAAFLPECEAVRVYASQTTVSAKNVKNALKTGVSFMHMDGHCWMTYLSVYKPGQFDQFEKGIGIWHLPFFSNTEYPIAVIGGCRTAQFNVAVFNKPEQTVEPPVMAKYFPALYSLSWGFVRTSNGGSVATIGYTIPPFFGMGEHGDEDNDGIEEPDILEIGMGMLEPMVFYAHGMEGKQHLGDCWGYSLNKYIDTFGDVEDVWQPWNTATIHGFVLLGDPSLKIGGYPSARPQGE